MYSFPPGENAKTNKAFTRQRHHRLTCGRELLAAGAPQVQESFCSSGREYKRFRTQVTRWMMPRAAAAGIAFRSSGF